MGPSADDLDLAARAALGDHAAFGMLARRHGPAIRGLLRRMGAGPALADDLAQDAFVIAFERIAQYRGDGSFEGWIKRIAARRYIRHARTGLRFEQLPDRLDESVGEGEGETALRLDLDQALSLLSAPERLCVTLCHGVGFSQTEVAEALNAPLGTVKSHTARGLAKLRRRMVPDGEERR